MEAILFLALFATAFSKNIPSAVYKPTDDQLRLIFGDSPPSDTKPSTADKPDKELFDGIFSLNNTELLLKNDSNVTLNEDHVELNKRININSNKGSKNETVKVVMNVKSSGDSAKLVKEDAAKEMKKNNTSDVDDRVALGVMECPVGEVRVGNVCIESD